MDAVRAKELAAKAQLDFGDWLEITGVDIGEHGMYSVASDGIRFRPNKNKGKSGWSKGQKKDAICLVPPGEKYKMEQQLEQENTSQLEIPCSPNALVEFALERDVSGDLHGLLPGLFIAAVYKQELRPQREPRPGHLLAVAGLLELLLEGGRQNHTQSTIAEEISTRHPGWRGVSISNLSKLFAEAKTVAKDAESEAQSKAEALEAASHRINKRNPPRA